MASELRAAANCYEAATLAGLTCVPCCPARTGNPSIAELRWPAYDLNTRSTMIFNVHSTVVADPRSAERQLLASLPEIKHLG